MSIGRRVNLDDLRVKRTYKMLNEAMLSLLCEKDFDSITVGELCERAMVRRATFYSHFADKYDFFSFFVRSTRESFPVSSEPKPAAYCLEMFRQGGIFFENHIELVHNAVNSPAFSMMYSTLCSQMHEDVKKRFLSAGVCDEADSELLTCLYVGGCTRVLQRWLEEKNRPPIDVLTGRLASLIQRVIT